MQVWRGGRGNEITAGTKQLLKASKAAAARAKRAKQKKKHANP